MITVTPPAMEAGKDARVGAAAGVALGCAGINASHQILPAEAPRWWFGLA